MITRLHEVWLRDDLEGEVDVEGHKESSPEVDRESRSPCIAPCDTLHDEFGDCVDARHAVLNFLPHSPYIVRHVLMRGAVGAAVDEAST